MREKSPHKLEGILVTQGSGMLDKSQSPLASKPTNSTSETTPGKEGGTKGVALNDLGGKSKCSTASGMNRMSDLSRVQTTVYTGSI